jgi:acetyl/propionyl-CoA carboxylase alpha subunit
VLEVDGLETNRELLSAVLADPDFRAGDAGIDYLERRPDLRDAALDDGTRHRHAAAAAFALLGVRATSSLVPVAVAGWRNVGTAEHVDVFSDALGSLSVRSGVPDQPLALLAGAAWEEVGVAQATGGPTGGPSGGPTVGTVDLVSHGMRRRYRVRLAGTGVDVNRAYVNGPEGQSTFTRRTEDDPDERGGLAGECRAPLPGTVAKVLVTVGETVSDGAGLVVLEAMKMEHTLPSTGLGTVSQVLCAPGDQVDVGDLLVVVEPA